MRKEPGRRGVAKMGERSEFHVVGAFRPASMASVLPRAGQLITGRQKPAGSRGGEECMCRQRKDRRLLE